MPSIMNIHARMVAAVCACIAVSSFAQEPPKSASPAQEIPRLAGETLEVSIVNLDVVVTDKKGGRVAGLTKGDFEIIEDGKPQPVSNFAEYRNDADANTTIGEGQIQVLAKEHAAPSQPRTLIVFIDNLHLPNFKKDPVFDSLKKTLHSIVRPGDAVLVARWRTNLHVEQSFTSDLARLDAAVDRASKESGGIEADLMTQIRNQQAEFIEMMEEVAAQTNSTYTPDANDPVLMFDVNNQAQLIYWEMQEKIKALNALMAAVPPQSKKALIMLASQMSAVAGGQYYYGTQAGSGPLPPDVQQRFNTRSMLQTVIDSANSRGITVYPMFPEGLKTDMDSNPAMRGTRALRYQNFGNVNYQTLINELSSLQEIAKQTGGAMQWSAVEVAKALPAIKDDLTSYYSLAYRVPPRHDGKRHQVSVRVKDRSLNVRSRKQAVEQPETVEMHDRVIATLYANAVRPVIPIELELGNPQRQAKNRFLIPTKVRVPLANLMTVNDGKSRKGAFTIYFASARAVGAAADVMKQTIPFNIPAGRPAADSFVYQFDMLTDFLTTRIAVVVYDEVSHDTGFARAEMPRGEKN
jgi:VWFA-related protein